MNYRHAFHAGNIADCMKHAVLVWLLRAMTRKLTPFFVLDTHAGAGRYDLGSDAARRTGEAAAGIFALLDDTPVALRDYVGLVRALGDDGAMPSSSGDAQGALPSFAVSRDSVAPLSTDRHGVPSTPEDKPGDLPPPSSSGPSQDTTTLRTYPGSPGLIHALLRPNDHLACCELHPEDSAALRSLFRRFNQASVHHRDGWEALKALLPPKQKRGLILIDPPYEDPGEFTRLAGALTEAHARFRTGVFAAWYPVKRRAQVRELFAALPMRDVVAVELLLREPLDAARLNGSGLIVVNPPFRFEAEIPQILTALLDRLGMREPGEAASVTRLADE